MFANIINKLNRLKMRRSFKITESITNKNKTKSFSQYLVNVARIPMFESAEAELKCAIKASNGDQDAIQEMVMRNLRFVISVANKYENKNAPIEDLVNQGNIGLQEAAMKFDPSKGFKFISYAVWYIRKEIMQFMSNNTRLIRIPVNRVNSLGRFYEQIDLLAQELDRLPEVSDLYGNLEGFDDRKIDSILGGCAITTSSLDRPVDISDARGATMVDFFVSEDSDKFEDETINSSRHIIINEILDFLKPKEKASIIYYFGLNGNEQLSAKSISKKVGLTPEGVRVVIKRALKKLKERIKTEKLGEELF
jgi:RNA polymerase primary sigma factor